MDATYDTLDDVSALAWVQDELRKSLDAAHKALRRTLKETESTYDSDLDDTDPAQLRIARQHLHQGVGVLELVGLPAGAALLRGSEAVVQRYISKPHKLESPTVDAIERASFALLDFLARRLAGKPVSPVALFPQYSAVQELAGAERVHPADLWPRDWQWHAIEPDAGAAPRGADALVTAEFESQALVLMRNPAAAVLRRLSELSAGLAAGAGHPHTATLWRLAAGFFEAQAEGLLTPDVYSKRINSRLLAQLRSQQKDPAAAGERLAQDLTFFCVQAREPAPGTAPRLAAVRRAYPPGRDPLPADYHEVVLGRYDPAWVTQARKRVASARDSWSAVAGGEMHRLSGLNEQFTLVAESLRRLVPGGDGLGEALTRVAAAAVQSAAAPEPALAMEVATSVLYLEAALEDGAFDQPGQAERVKRLAQRIEAVRAGAAPEALEPWMEELYRRVSDRQTLGSVVHELRGALSESEKLIDQFFRAPADPSVLIPVPGQLQAMRGVLSVLGLEQATQAVLRMRDDVDALIAAGAQAEQQLSLFDRLAGNLSALSFLIDLLGVQPQVVKAMFRFDPASGLLRSVLGQPAVRNAAAAQIDLGQSEADDFAVTAIEAVALDEPAPLAGPSSPMPLISLSPPPAAPPPAAASGLEDDAEMRDIFLEEAREVIDTARGALAVLRDSPADVEQLTTVRRAFHTLKGSSRMVGLTEFGEAAWAFEQLYNAWLASQRPADGDLLQVSEAALDHLEQWTAAIAAGDQGDRHGATARRVADALRLDGRRIGFDDAAVAAPALPPLSLLLPPASDLDLVAPAPVAAPVAIEPPPAPVEETPAFPGMDFSFDLGELVEPQAPPEPSAAPALEAPNEAPQEAAGEALPAPAIALTFDLAEPEALPEPSLEPLALPEPVPLAAPEVVERLAGYEVDHGYEIAPTSPAPLDEGTLSPALEDAQITSVQFDIPAEVLPSGDDAPAVFEPLQPSVPVAEGFDEPLADEAAAPDAGVIEGSWSGPAGDGEAIVEALQPSRPASLDALAEAPTLPPAAIEPEPLPPEAPADSEQVKVVGPLRIAIPLFNIYLNEADELSRRLATELSEWALELQRPVGESTVALAHSLAGSSATVGFAELSALARQLEHVLEHAQALGHGSREDAQVFVEVAEEVRRLLHQFAAGFLKSPPDELGVRLHEQGVDIARRLEEAQRAAALASESGPQTLAPAEALVPMEPAEVPVPAEPEVPVAEPGSAVMAEVPPPVWAEAAAPEAPPGPVEPRVGELGQAEFKPFVPLAPELAQPASATALDSDEDVDATDVVDVDLFPFFEEEAQELLPALTAQLRDWVAAPQQPAHAGAAMRTLHTLKGGARLAGAMRLGELAHRLETAIEHLLQRETAEAADVEALLGRADAIAAGFERLRQRDVQAYAAAQAAVEPLHDTADSPVVTTAWPPLDEPAVLQDLPVPMPVLAEPPTVAEPRAASAAPDAAEALEAGDDAIDWSRFAPVEAGRAAEARAAGRQPVAATAAVRVRPQLLDRLVNQAGEVSIARARLESGVAQMRGSVGDLTENLERLRQQLRDIELQAETQMGTRMEAAKAAAQSFDPLEFDRFTRFQELTRMMAESVNDVATVQRTLQRTLEAAEDELAAQARLTRDLQDDLLRTRMVEFEGLSERLYRVVRQAAKETGKQVRLDIVGGSIEVDRGVLDRMTGAFEHLLRNCVTHGIEAPEVRAAVGKDAAGHIVVALRQEGNEVSVEFRDDGAGLDLPRIRDKGVALGLIDAAAPHTDAELANLIFMPGFSTAANVTELAGRGVGMDVVRSDVNALGGRIETASAPGQGTSFKLVLPLTTAVTQVVMLRCGQASVAVPATLIEIVRRATPAEIGTGYRHGLYHYGEQTLPFFWLGALLQQSARGEPSSARTQPVIVIRSAAQRIALHVDEVLGNQEVVVKNLGPQLSRLPGLAGMTLLASGAVSLIYNPVALATVYAEAARAAMAEPAAAPAQPLEPAAPAVPLAPLVLVVDDSLTVRRVTQRLLAREGYRVVLAKDGLDALEKLADELPAVVLSDIEMPRMDGFDLVRNLRGDARLAALPVVMITSRIAQKHRDYAAELGVNHYLGKPYNEDELLGLIGRYCAQAAPA